jgi:hypothetical protein
MNEIRIKCYIRGTRPLLMNAFVEEAGRGPSKKGKHYDDREEAEKRLYLDEAGKICQPATHLEACMVKSAADFKFTGRKTYKEVVKSGVFVEPLMIEHGNPNWLVDRQGVVIQRARIIRCRPRFDQWELAFEIILRDERLQPMIIKEILESGGKYVGIGDYRPRYGLFEVLIFDLVKAIGDEAA